MATFALPGADPRLAALRSTRAITIGESADTSFSAYASTVIYTLVRVSDGFAGEGQFEFVGYAMGGGGTPVLRLTDALPAVLPTAAASDFLRQLASTRSRKSVPGSHPPLSC